MQLDNSFVMPNGVTFTTTFALTNFTSRWMNAFWRRTSHWTVVLVLPCFYACRERLSQRRHEDWEYLVEKIDFSANQDPEFVQKNARPAIVAEEFIDNGVNAKWIVYGDFLGDQNTPYYDSSSSQVLKPTSAQNVYPVPHQWWNRACWRVRD